MERAKEETTKPTFIRLRSVIAFPAPNKMNTGASHGSALGADEITGIKQALDFPDAPFPVEEEIVKHARGLVDRGANVHAQWQKTFDEWAAANPESKKLFDRLYARELPTELSGKMPTWDAGESIATRKASEATLQVLGAELPELWGGSAGQPVLPTPSSRALLPSAREHFYPQLHHRARWSQFALRYPRARHGRNP